MQRWSNPVSLCCAVLMALCFFPQVVLAQSSSSLQGQITDTSGGAIPEAAVTLKNAENDSQRQALSDATGHYSFTQVPPGKYALIVQRPGFAMVTREGVVLQVNTPASLNIQLDVGKTTDVVNVTADATTINTTDGSVGNAFTENQIRQLPLETRNVVELLSLQPGVTPTGEVLGGRRDQNNITLDGVDVNDNQNAGIAISKGTSQGSNANGTAAVAGFNSVLPVPLDSVQEFRVTVAGQGANEGRSSGGQVVLITKSGTNQLHGSAYEYNRNTIFAANDFFSNRAGIDRQTLNRNQFGASLGGKIIKDRIFYFFNYERRIDASSLAQERAVPSQNLKNGLLTIPLSNGTVETLNAAQIQAVDPLHIGLNQGYLNLLQQYPAGNDPAYGADGGYNFSGYRFNAPNDLDNRAYVAKMDFILDHAAKNTLSIRGTLSNANQDLILAQFPGQAPASQLLNNSKGLGATLTSVLQPTLVNTFTFGLTRQGLSQSGVGGENFSLYGINPLQNYNARADGRILPVYNYTDDLTWTKGRHTITTGIDFRLMTNNTYTYANSYPGYGWSPNVAVGLGEDIQNDLTTYVQAQPGNSSVTLNDPFNAGAAMGALLGLVNNTNITYQFERNGNVLPQGAAQARHFKMNEYEAYVADSWRVKPSLTLIFGLRYSNDRPPYETTGLQVAPNIGLDQFFAQRNGLAQQGVPSFAMPNATLSYSLNGPVNGKPSWWNSDNNNFAPRFGMAYAPADADGWLGKIFGKNGAFRVGAAQVYDRFGSQLITQFDQFGSFGLSTTLNNPTSYDFTTSPRYNGSPANQPAAPAGGFPYTPPDVAAISGEFQGIYPNLRTPYAWLFNASLERQIPGKMVLEVGYVGRFGRKLLLQGDVYTPMENYKDPVSGQTWVQSMTSLRQTYNSLSAAAGFPGQNAPVSQIASEVQANPSLVPTNPFIESMFPGLANYAFPGSASANYFYQIYGTYGGSYLDMLHASDRILGNFLPGQCLSKPGCYTFFALQGSSMPSWQNAGESNYNAMVITVRRALSNGISFDLNYTWSHSIDNASSAEGAAGQDGAVIQNIYQPGQFRGSSDFDIRQSVNANVVYQLPFGTGQKFLNTSHSWLNAIVGGWQVSSIMRFTSGLPTVVQGNSVWNTNYWQNSLAIVTGPVKSGQTIDQNGVPSLFANTSTSSSFADSWPGSTGTRAALRLPGFSNIDLAATKSFHLPIPRLETSELQFRAEAFNAFNWVNFISPSLALSSQATFGEFSATTPARVMQFALRYQF
ncbi:MAG: carboxypeptidase regulatory-like domain-containing protein [Bryobacteraceae bacterium]